MSVSKVTPLIFKDMLSLLTEASRIEQSLCPIATTVLNINLLYLIVSLKIFSLNLICNPLESLLV